MENRFNGLISFIDNVTRDIKHLQHANEIKYWNNLTNNQRSALLRLSGDKKIVIKLADNGEALVIMDSNKCNEVCLQQLTDNEYYDEIKHDPNTEYRQVIDSTIDKMSAADLITDFESTKMKEGTCTPLFLACQKFISRICR